MSDTTDNAQSTTRSAAPSRESLHEALDSLLDVVERLTAPDGCPWDREQTPDSLSEYVIEESHELVSAIRSGRADDVCEEMGDVAFLLLFLSHLYAKKGDFSLEDALRRNAAKMIHRHPHVFAGQHFDSLDEQLKAWERLKKEEHAAEGKPEGVFDSLPRNLDPLARAYRIHSKAARVGFTWEGTEDVEQQVESEWLEFLDACAREDTDGIRHELGDLVFSIVELGRRHGLKANAELDFANERFLSRFRYMEKICRETGKDLASMSLEDMDTLWAEAKDRERAEHPRPSTEKSRGVIAEPAAPEDGAGN